MNTLSRSALVITVAGVAMQAQAQITFYENDDFRGRSFSASQAVVDFRTLGFNDDASSVVVEGGRWEVCENTDFGGQCVVLQPGNYRSLGEMGMNDRLSSTRPVDGRRTRTPDAPPPNPAAPYDYRRRPNERIFQAPVTSVRAVVGEAGERCWVERQPDASPDGQTVGRGVLGAVIGGVIGHQIGGGTGRDLATVGGAVAGAAIGANSARDRSASPGREVRRCEAVPSTTPTYWDVGYEFRGVQHQMQMRTAPGPTVDVNRRGEPRQ